ncbi:MAG: 3-dehydroquinate synthase [Eubacteriales bacterium]
MKELTVDLKDQQYQIIIESGLFASLETHIRTVYTGDHVVVISDETVWALYGEKFLSAMERGGYQAHPLVFPQGETTKSIENFAKGLEFCGQHKLPRTGLVVALGGGVIGDLAGFIAASYMRGVNLVQIPTTLLSQVDSSVGGKTAINLPQGKNLVGAFYQPNLVLIDPDNLNTLPPRDFASGMAEIIKTGAIFSLDFFEKLEKLETNSPLPMEEIIAFCCDLKRIVVEEDEKEQGRRALLNFGHTFGHAIEKLGNFTRYTHGEGVALGMVLASHYGEMTGHTPQGTATRIYEICKKYHLPVEDTMHPTEMTELFALDKKAENKDIKLILAKKIGECTIERVSLEAFSDQMIALEERLNHHEADRNSTQ